jgi:polyisoprenoid-binding protein YceI
VSDLRTPGTTKEDLMSTVAAQPFSGTFRADPVHSSIAFAIRHSGVYTYRGSLSDVGATLHADDAGTTLDGCGRVDSISVVEPPAFRAHVLGPDFFDAERHPEIAFSSTEVRLARDGRAEVDGELSIRGVTRLVTATGRYEGPRADVFGGEVAGLHLQTSFDRRDFGFDWQMEMPDGDAGLGWDVELEIDLRLARDDDGGEEW